MYICVRVWGSRPPPHFTPWSSAPSQVGKCIHYRRFGYQGSQKRDCIEDFAPRAVLQGPRLQRSRVARRTQRCRGHKCNRVGLQEQANHSKGKARARMTNFRSLAIALANTSVEKLMNLYAISSYFLTLLLNQVMLTRTIPVLEAVCQPTIPQGGRGENITTPKTMIIARRYTPTRHNHNHRGRRGTQMNAECETHDAPQPQGAAGNVSAVGGRGGGKNAGAYMHKS